MTTNKLMEYFPPMLFGYELDKQLINLPEYDPEICRADAGTRLLHLNRLSDIYIPSQIICNFCVAEKMQEYKSGQ